MKRLLFAGILAVLGAQPAITQVPRTQGEGPSLETGTVPLTYTGGDSRVSVGVDQDGNSQGELMQVFGNNGEHAVVAQLWWGNGGAGGIQADYNWLFGTTLEQARQDPDSITVAKLSFAIDQNAEKDRQANVGLSIERKEFFLNFFLSGKASGAHNAGAVNVQQQQIVSGTDDAGIYTQTKTDIATTLLLAQPYSTIVGIHGGHFSDALAARFNGGLDYAKGDQGANQKRVSLGVDKYLGIRGWSLSGIVEHAQNTPVVGNDTSDTRWWLFLRYEFGGGGAFRPFDDSAAANAAWIDRALHEPVTGHARNVDTYVTKGKTTTTTTLGPKHYSARVPIARDDTVSVVEDSGATAIDVLGNDADPDNNVLAVNSAGPAGHGTVLVAAGQVQYTPAPGYTGPDAFPYTITNSKGLSASATVHITVTAGTPPPPPPPKAGAPVARDDTATTAYAQPVTVGVLGNDSDPNSYPLTVTAATTPAHGSSHVNGDGTITYTPNAAFTGSDRFTYSIDNAHGGTASANVTIVVQPPSPPQARDDSATTGFATPVDIAVLANDSSPAGYPLSVSEVGTPSNGSTKILTGGAVRYTPALGFTGTDTFAYKVDDGHGGVAGANVTVTVLPQSGTFQLRDDTATTANATPVSIDVLANDSAPDGDTLTIKKITTPQHGTAVFSAGGIVYTPSAAFNGGTDTFEYTAGDGSQTATAKVTVTVLPPGLPVAQNDTATTPFNSPVTIAVLANDSDPHGYPLTVESVTTPVHGSTAINPNGTVTYTPQTTFAGDDTFSYTINNGHGGTATANATVTVLQPAPPVAQADTATTPFNKPISIAVLSNDSDPANLSLSVTQVTQPANGSTSLGTGGAVTYTPHTNFIGNDSFSYTISDGFHSTSANVSVTVQQPLPPVAVPDSIPIPFGTTSVKVSVLANDSDPNALPLTVTAVTQPANAAAHTTVNLDGTITYQPDPEKTGSDTFSYTITNHYFTASALVTVTVQAPLPPVARNDSMAIAFNTPTTVPVLSNDTDPNGIHLIILDPVTTPAVHGDTTVNNSDGTITYTPRNALPPFGTALEPYVGSDSFTYTVNNNYFTATATVNVAVQLPPPPIANNDTAACSIGGIVTIPILDNDTPQFGLPLTVSNVTTPTGGGDATLNADYTISYSDPLENGPRVDTFNYSISDPYGQTSMATVTVTIN